MLVTDCRRSSRTDARRALPELVVAAVAGGVDAVQLREPDLDAAARLRLAGELRDAIAGRATLLINSDATTAAAVGAGVHLPEAVVEATSVRRQLGADAFVGRSVHSVAAAAATTGVDYLLAGHVFPSASKPGKPPLGLDGLRLIVAASRVPVLAIGGITAERVAATMATGAAGVAVIGAIAEGDDPQRAASELRAAVEYELEQSMGQTQTGNATAAITATINGKAVPLVDGSTITDFITGKGFTAEMVIVERNGGIVPRPAYPTTLIEAGDRLEIVHAVGGG
jgi:thiamine biosynthesis protein ThiS